jgi:Holliday junction resolvase RusA-like endonuclease
VDESHTFSVMGKPVPQGSMKAFIVAGRPVITSATKGLKEWRNLIAYRAQDYLREQGLGSLTQDSIGFFQRGEAVNVTAVFQFSRPKSHLRRDGSLTKSAPREKASKPDIDKLARAVLDALTGVMFHDDSQVVELTVSKRYSDPGASPGVEITVERNDLHK